jgi:hypothetical protein
MERDHKVEVWGKTETVTTYQKSPSVWIAVGKYMGEHLEIKSRTESQAIKHWHDAAKYRGN